MPEEICENEFLQYPHAAEGFNVALHPARALAELGDFVQGEDKRPEETWNLDVLVDEHESVWHVVVSQVHRAGADPATDFSLHLREDLLHGNDAARGLLHALEALTRVREIVGMLLIKEVLLGKVPELEHVVKDLTPERHGLQHERVLPLMRMREARPFHPLFNGQGVLWRTGVHWVEVFLQEPDQAVARLPVEANVRAVVAQRVDALLDHILGELVAVLCVILRVGFCVARAQETQ
mmetsp:Transcript_15325/g.34819  ORF Transcript_15325/g.34819 Transcript_15325/m.34819 type:complete len:237 (-) Transcript_15325:954-1664(-)